MVLTIELANDMRRMYRTGYFTQAALADIFRCCQMTVSKVIRGTVYVDARPSEQERFASFIDKSPGFGPNGDCYGWKGTIGDGYAKFKRARERGSTNASRMAWEFANGLVPEGYEICHRCDNRSCCKLDHLFLGTHLENMQDMSQKLRLRRKVQ